MAAGKVGVNEDSNAVRGSVRSTVKVCRGVVTPVVQGASNAVVVVVFVLAPGPVVVCAATVPTTVIAEKSIVKIVLMSSPLEDAIIFQVTMGNP
jgi:hypothetical protein